MNNPFHGSHVALPTPFRDSELDLEALRALVQAHVEAPTAGVVVSGTTGEAATLSRAERRTVLEVAVEQAAGRIRVMAGVGTNVTADSVQLAQEAADLGVDGLLVVTPYYNRPSPAGLDLHFDAVAEAVDLPVVLYNVPSRTGVDLAPQQAKALCARHGNIVAIKEATTSSERIQVLCADSELEVLCGEDSRMLEFMRLGAVGAVNVSGNLLPALVAELIACGRPGADDRRAADLATQLDALLHALFVETNPVPLKAALGRLGLCSAEVRAPLAALEAGSQAMVETTLGGYEGLIATSRAASS